MELKIIVSERKLLLFIFILFQLVSNNILGQSWSIEYVLNGDSSVYKLSQDKVKKGKSVDFLFPAYKFNQTSSIKVIESVRIENNEIIEVEFNSKDIVCDQLNFEIDIYAEGIDSIGFFLKKEDGELIFIKQQASKQGYTYLPTAFFSVDLTNTDFKSIQIVGKSKRENAKFILGRLNGFKKTEFVANNMQALDSYLADYPFDKQSDIFDKLPEIELKLHGSGRCSRLVLNDCFSTFDSIRCISLFINKLLDEYPFYDVYGISKKDILKRNALLSKTVPDMDSYYKGLKEIIASLNCCHVRLTTNQIETVESPLQPIYFYKIKNEIVVTAIFDFTLYEKIQLGDKLISINNIPVDQIYEDFTNSVFASTSHQREMKITQRLLYNAMEMCGDNLLLEFQNENGSYTTYLSKTNFSNKQVVPPGFKIVSSNKLEKYDDVIYLRPDFKESILTPLLYSHKEDFNNCKGLILDLRGNSGGDLSSLTLFSFLISENSPVIYNESNLFHIHSNYTVKPSNKIQIKAPIVLIVDARTTCISELLINALRKSKSNIYVIGASNTTGSAQLAMMTILPKNAILSHFDGITKDAFGNLIDDNIGVLPDSLISLESYKDLLPYEDLLKHVALEKLGYTK